MKIRYRAAGTFLTVFLAGVLTGCIGGASTDTDTSIEDVSTGLVETSSVIVETQQEVVSEESITEKDVAEEDVEDRIEGDISKRNVQDDTARFLDFVDVYGEQYRVQIDPNVESHNYNPEAFKLQGDRMSYEDDAAYKYRLGLDVSYYQGDIDWEKVKADGFDFVFIRIGYRGYDEGLLHPDAAFEDYIEGAQEAGLDAGVYFFSQAISEEEAEEEAKFVLEILEGHELQLPVVYDPESILGKKARTDSVTGEQFTKNTARFCAEIEAAGYEPMIYSNMLWEAYNFDLEELSDYEIWYADYEAQPQTPYHFTFWQYYNKGDVDGIGTEVDLNIQLIPVEQG